MGSLNLKRASALLRVDEQKAELEREQRDAKFRHKVALQQFMNSNGPLFRAFAVSGVPVSEIMAGEHLIEAVKSARDLATLVASKLTGKDPSKVTAAESKPFRKDAAEWVAARCMKKGDLDIEAAADTIARAARLADQNFDHDLYKDDGITSTTSLMMTAAGVAGTLSQQVEIYDFRQGKEKVLGRLVHGVAEAAAATASQMLGSDAPEADIRNLTQTLARNLASLMAACYERRAREVVKTLKGRTEAEKRVFLSFEDPVEGILTEFKEWSVCFSGYALATARELTPDAKGPKEPTA